MNFVFGLSGLLVLQNVDHLGFVIVLSLMAAHYTLANFELGRLNEGIVNSKLGILDNGSESSFLLGIRHKNHGKSSPLAAAAS